MTAPTLDVLCVGNAIVDLIARAEEDLLVREGLAKGSMGLVDAERAARLAEVMGPATIVSGGSAANTAAGLASLGLRAGFVGRVRADEAGHQYAHDIRAAGVDYRTPFASGGAPTGRCLVLVTPDGERTMSTHLGACQDLGPEDLDEAQVASAGVLYLEGYLWDPPRAKAAFRRAAEVAHAAGRLVALSLSDAFCVDRYRAEFLGLLRDGTVDVLFANRAELLSLYETADLEAALAALREDLSLREDASLRGGAPLAVVTLGPEGAMAVTRGATVRAPALPVERVVDTTGAGDLFAAGFLAALVRGRPHAEGLRLGALAAAEIIAHVGARPQAVLADLAAQQGLAA